MSFSGMLSASLKPSSVWYWLRWVFLVPAVLMVFILLGSGSYAFFGVLGLWERPLSPTGFLVAFSFVLVAYVFAPDYRLSLATLALFLGGVLAWIVLSPPTRVTNEPGEAGLSFVPIVTTYVGGLVGWVVCYRHALRRTAEPRRGAV